MHPVTVMADAPWPPDVLLKVNEQHAEAQRLVVCVLDGGPHGGDSVRAASVDVVVQDIREDL